MRDSEDCVDVCVCADVRVDVEHEHDKYERHSGEVEFDSGKCERHSGEVEGGEGVNESNIGEIEAEVENDVIEGVTDDDISDSALSSMLSTA